VIDYSSELCSSNKSLALACAPAWKTSSIDCMGTTLFAAFLQEDEKFTNQT